MKKIIEKKLITISIIFSIIIIAVAYFVYNFLIKFANWNEKIIGNKKILLINFIVMYNFPN